MKRLTYLSIAIVVLASVMVMNSNAQTTGGHRVVANIPFEFSFGKANLPSGKYTITVLNPSSDRKILQILSADGRSTAMVWTTSEFAKISDNAKLVFDRYGDRYFFSHAQMAGDSTSIAALKTKAEKAERRAVARSNKKTVVEITAG